MGLNLFLNFPRVPNGFLLLSSGLGLLPKPDSFLSSDARFCSLTSFSFSSSSTSLSSILPSSSRLGVRVSDSMGRSVVDLRLVNI